MPSGGRRDPDGWVEVKGRVAPLPVAPSSAVNRTGRITVNDQFSSVGPQMQIILPPPLPDADWYNFRLDDRSIRYLPPHRLMEVIGDISPDFSNAIWTFLRLCNPGWKVDVTTPGTQDPNPRGQQVVDAFLSRLDDLYGSVDVLWGRMFMAACMRGAFLMELVMDEGGREAIDLALPDPATVRFRRMYDDLRGVVWEPGQYQGRDFTSIMGYPTVRYVPIDPHVGNPYGRALFAPAVFSSIFLLGVLHDLRRVIANQGWDRNDVSIVLENLRASMPPEDRDNEEKWIDWVEAAIDQTRATLEELGPTDTFVHTDTAQMGRPVGTNSTGGLQAIATIVERLEHQLGRALKTMPLLMGMTDGASEANANRQWEVQAAGVKSIQHYAETGIERLLMVDLQAQGIQADVCFRFAELRAAELMRDAQVQQMEWTNIAFARDQGWIDQEEASDKAVNHPPAAPAPAPAASPQPAVTDPNAGGNPEPGGNRSAHQHLLLDGACLTCGEGNLGFTPTGSGLPLPPVPDTVTITEEQRRLALMQWDLTVPDLAGLLDAAVE